MIPCVKELFLWAVCDGLDLLAQVIPISRLLAVDEGHLVVATLDGHHCDALQGQVEPAFGLANKGSDGHAGFHLSQRLCRRVCTDYLPVLAKHVLATLVDDLVAANPIGHGATLSCEALFLAVLTPVGLHLFHEEHLQLAEILELGAIAPGLLDLDELLCSLERVKLFGGTA